MAVRPMLVNTQQDRYFQENVVQGLDGIWLTSTILVTTTSLLSNYTFYLLRHWHTAPWCPLWLDHGGHGAIQPFDTPSWEKEMKPFVCNKVTLTHYTNDAIRLDGSVLNGIDLLAWTDSFGKQLIWMDEVGDLQKQPVVGFILVRWDELARKDMATAQRAILTNSTDLNTALTLWPDKLKAPSMVWLGVSQRRNLLLDSEDVGLPSWAWGYEVIEAVEPIGCFAALGYCSPGQEARFEIAKDYYCELLVEECAADGEKK